MLPNVITSIVEANIALQRLNKFLLGKELDKTAVQRLPSSPSDDAVVVMKGLHSYLLVLFPFVGSHRIP